MDTPLQTGGYPLAYSQSVRLMLARALVSQPQVLLIDGIFDLLDPDERWTLWKSVAAIQPSQTIVIATHDPRIAADCDSMFRCQLSRSSNQIMA